MKKPTRTGYYWRKVGVSWQPVWVARTNLFNAKRSELVWQPFGSPFAYDVVADRKWGEKIERLKAAK